MKEQICHKSQHMPYANEDFKYTITSSSLLTFNASCAASYCLAQLRNKATTTDSAGLLMQGSESEDKDGNLK